RNALAPMAHYAPPHHAALNVDGSRGMTFDGRVLRVWDLTCGEPQSPAGRPPERGVAYSPDGKRLVRHAADTAQVYDAATGQKVGEAMKVQGKVVSATFSPGGDRVLTVADPKPGEHDVMVWDAATGKALFKEAIN